VVIVVSTGSFVDKFIGFICYLQFFYDLPLLVPSHCTFHYEEILKCTIARRESNK